MKFHRKRFRLQIEIINHFFSTQMIFGLFNLTIVITTDVKSFRLSGKRLPKNSVKQSNLDELMLLLSQKSNNLLVLSLKYSHQLFHMGYQWQLRFFLGIQGDQWKVKFFELNFKFLLGLESFVVKSISDEVNVLDRE